MSDKITIYESFESMSLNDNLLRGIYTYGFEIPSIIQKKSIIPIIESKDIIAQSQSGTGKTASFIILLFALFETFAIVVVKNLSP